MRKFNRYVSQGETRLVLVQTNVYSFRLHSSSSAFTAERIENLEKGLPALSRLLRVEAGLKEAVEWCLSSSVSLSNHVEGLYWQNLK